MTLRHLLAPPIGRTLRFLRGAAGVRPPSFRTVILHDVTEDTVESVIKCLDFIAAEYGFIEPDAAEASLENGAENSKPGKGSPCLLTVDDGFASAKKLGCEIFARYRVKGIFFICPGIIGKPLAEQRQIIRSNVFDGHPPKPTPSMMTWDDARALKDRGHTIGAHGMLHKRLSRLSASEFYAEIVESRDEIGRQIGVTPRWYAYAFGDIESISAPALRIIMDNFDFCRTGIRGSRPSGDNSILFAQELDLKSPQGYQRSVLDGTLDIFHIGARRQIKCYWREASLSLN